MARRPVVHLTFSYSAAGALLAALRELGRNERVIALPDDLALGPLRPLEDRERFMTVTTRHVAPVDWRRVPRLWRAVTSPEVSPMVWFSRRSASEHAGFLELLRRRQDAGAIRAVDVSAMELTTPQGRPALRQRFAFLGSDVILLDQLYERAVRLPAAAVARDRERWAELRAENASLRVLRDGVLTSQLVTYFDETIVRLTPAEWRAGMYVVGRALAATSEGEYSQLDGDGFLVARIDYLATAGEIEQRGENLDDWEVRLPPRRRRR